MITLNCVICGAEFDSVRGQKACSKEHRHTWKRREMERRAREKRRLGRPPCHTCGGPIPSDRHAANLTCSEECRRLMENEQSRGYRRTDQERHRAYGKKYRTKIDRKKVNAWFREWYANNHEKRHKRLQYGKKWRKAHPELTAAYTNSWRARRKGASGSHTAAEAQELLKRQKYKCAVCQTDIRKVKKTRDHIAPLSKGGTDDIKNIQWLCQPCNSRKHNKDPLEFAREQGLLL